MNEGPMRGKNRENFRGSEEGSRDVVRGGWRGKKGCVALAPLVPTSRSPHGGFALLLWQHPSPNPRRRTGLHGTLRMPFKKLLGTRGLRGAFSAQSGVRGDTFCGAVLSWGPRRADLRWMSWCLLPSWALLLGF